MKNQFFRRWIISTAALLWGCLAIEIAVAADAVSRAGENVESRQWFQDAKFGMFIHWGVYSVPARGEWVMENEHIPARDYEQFASQFNPTEFDAAKIVSIAKRAGMQYITITSKHHDGFAMWATKQSIWNIVDATPYKRDPLKALADEAHRQGIKLFFYYSQMDWHHPDYWPLGTYGHFSGRPQNGDFGRYLDFVDAQLTELLTQYGEVGGIWFDGMWDKPEADWRLQRTYALIHRLQPAALIGSNHHRVPFPGEDFQMFEKDLPGANSAGFNNTHVADLPLETCETINNAWGYNRADKNFKSVPQLLRYLVRAAGSNANLLLNVGPTERGEVQPEFVDRLDKVGEWLKTHGETIYGTREGPITPRSWGVTTTKGGKIYVHILDWQDDYLVLPPIVGIKSARAFETGENLNIKPIKGALLLTVPKDSPELLDRIVVLEH